jgi:hypothetical protein
VKLQFALERFTIAGDGERARLRAPLPVALARLQRRDAYRVEPPPQATPRLWGWATRIACFLSIILIR